MLKLCTLALDTVVPSSSTGSKSAIGFISPVLDALHSIPVSFVSAISSFHLNAIAFLGNLEVCPSELPYAISSSISTSPSEGKSFLVFYFQTILLYLEGFLHLLFYIQQHQIPVLPKIPFYLPGN